MNATAHNSLQWRQGALLLEQRARLPLIILRKTNMEFDKILGYKCYSTTFSCARKRALANRAPKGSARSPSATNTFSSEAIAPFEIESENVGSHTLLAPCQTLWTKWLRSLRKSKIRGMFWSSSKIKLRAGRLGRQRGIRIVKTWCHDTNFNA